MDHLVDFLEEFFRLEGLEEVGIGRYLIRAPFSVDKIQYSCREGSVIYKTKMVKGPNRNFQVYDPLDFLAAVTAHIPEQLDVKYVPFFDS